MKLFIGMVAGIMLSVVAQFYVSSVTAAGDGMVRAKGFLLKDDKGITRACMMMSKEGRPMINLYNEQGDFRFGVGMTGKGVILSGWGSDDGPRFSLEATEDIARLNLLRKKNDVAFSATASKTEAWNDPNRMTSIKLIDSKGRLAWSALRLRR